MVVLVLDAAVSEHRELVGSVGVVLDDSVVPRRNVGKQSLAHLDDVLRRISVWR